MIYKFIVNIVPLFFAIVLHELSHGIVARWLGDNTAEKANRLNLYNHFDFWGSFVIPVGLYLVKAPFLIGYAKPVPINPMNFKNPLNDMALVAVAGPLCNFILAFIGAQFLPSNLFYLSSLTMYQEILLNFVAINLGLFFFNLIPIPPLDGSRILAACLPIKFVPTFYRYESFGIIIVIMLEIISRQIANLFGSDSSMFTALIGKPIITTLKMLI